MIKLIEMIKRFFTPELLAMFRKTVSPIEGHDTLIITGAYPKYTSGKKHVGIDFACRKGENFISICKGEVVWIKTGKNGKPGASTVKFKPKGKDYFILYKHCKPCVKKGDIIKRGDTLGHADLSGNTTGYHLHFEVRSYGKHIEPLTVLNKFQPRLSYLIMSNKKYHKKIVDIFKKYNKVGWSIINE